MKIVIKVVMMSIKKEKGWELIRVLVTGEGSEDKISIRVHKWSQQT